MPTPAASCPRPKMCPTPTPNHAAIPTFLCTTRAGSHAPTAAATSASVPDTNRASSHLPAAAAATVSTAIPTSTPASNPAGAHNSADANAICKIIEDLDPESMSCLPAFMTDDQVLTPQVKQKAQTRSKAKKKARPETETESDLTEEEAEEELAGTKGGWGRRKQAKATPGGKAETATATTTTKATTKKGKANTGNAKHTTKAGTAKKNMAKTTSKKAK
ncbi:hypothetical protein FRC06_005267 [Ceratobasidium sp. 370]|nr:hypothetical protein FRC06_005267 [Ceratobasidium sp. 370]